MKDKTAEAMVSEIKKALLAAVKKAGFEVELEKIVLEHPAVEEHGDYSTNVAFRLENPPEAAKKIAALLEGNWEIKVTGPFINFFLSPEWLVANLGRGEIAKPLAGQKIVVEFTDPNPFKELHVGHVYSNTVGEAISRLLEAEGAEVRRVTYQGDVGLHVAKSIWGIRKTIASLPAETANLEEKAAYMGRAYALGSSAYEEDPAAKEEINELNKKIYEGDPEIKEIYDQGKRWSLEYFAKFYAILGTKFEHNYFESEAGEVGLKLVKEHLKDGDLPAGRQVFEESDGAIVFRGEKHSLHTRVFVNKLGLPTYEAKELGLAPTKYRDFPYDLSIIITGNEINEYFKVLLKALSLINPDLAAKTTHLSHGMVRMPTGKMSSRTGNVLTAPWLLSEAEKLASAKMAEKSLATASDAAQKVAVAAIKYALLRSSLGHDIEFDFEKSIDFEGDSGPYLQYTCARAKSVLRKSKVKSPASPAGRQKSKVTGDLTKEETSVLRYLYRFPEVVEAAAKQYAPNLICAYLFELAKRFNAFYNEVPILKSETEAFRRKLVEATAVVLKNGLYLLGIEALERM